MACSAFSGVLVRWSLLWERLNYAFPGACLLDAAVSVTGFGAESALLLVDERDHTRQFHLKV